MYSFSRALSLGVVVLFFLVAPFFTLNAQLAFPGDQDAPGLVPCGDITDGGLARQCQLCHLENLARDLLRFAVYVAVFLATILIAYAGFRMVMAQGDTGAVKEAKEILVKAILGLVFVLSAWLIVDTLMKTFFSGGSGWNDFGQCIAQPGSTIKDGPVKGGGVSVVPQVPNNCVADEIGQIQCPGTRQVINGYTCESCVPIDPSIPGYNRAETCSAMVNGACQVDPVLNQQLLNLKKDLAAAGINWYVSEAWPPTVQHRSADQNAGKSVDVSACNSNTGVSGPTAVGNCIDSFNAAAARSSRLRAVYEVPSATDQQAILSANPNLTRSQVIVVTGVKPHLSIYQR